MACRYLSKVWLKLPEPILGDCQSEMRSSRASVQVFALAAWQSKLVSANTGDPPPSSIYQDQDSLQEHFVVGEPEFSPRTDSQDAWIFRSPLPSTVADATGFEMGQPR